MYLTPCIYFAGNAEEALNFYANALDDTIQHFGRYGDSIMASEEDWKNKIMHTQLVFGDNAIMIFDSIKASPAAGSNIQLCIDVKTPEELQDIFNKMGECGTVTMALQDTFWGVRFGMLKDKFGASWMFNCEIKKS